MGKAVIIILSWFIGVACATPVRVGHIIDGDTFSGQVMLADGVNISVRVRLRNVDTPELHGECEEEIKMARRARGRLTQLLPVGTVVEMQNIKDDKYLGRIDANVILENGADVGDILVKEELGRSYNGGRRNSWCKN